MVANFPHTRQDIFEMLQEVCDPEIPVVNIMEMGILRDVILHDNLVEVVITPTYTACPAMNMIEEDILSVLIKNGITDAKVITTYTPAWTTDMLNEYTKEKLRQFGISPPQHSCTFSMEQNTKISCPICNSENTTLISQFGSTACKALYKCEECQEAFDYFKCH